MIFSCIIPCSTKDLKSHKYKELVDSIRAQDFPQDQIEIITVTEGDSESAKGIGIKMATGEICAMFCADNYITEKDLFNRVRYFLQFSFLSAVYPWRYSYKENDNSLNRYFSLIGGNDPVCYYIGKNDRYPHVEELEINTNYPKSFGCNGFFYKADQIKNTNLDNYYPMDNALEVPAAIRAFPSSGIWHRTSDDLISFLKKRYKYARDLYCDRTNRRWRMLDTKEDYWNLFLFVIFTLTVIQPLSVSLKGFRKIRDFAWFWHWPVCVGFLITYSILTIRNLFKYGALFQKSPSSFRHTSVQTA